MALNNERSQRWFSSLTSNGRHRHSRQLSTSSAGKSRISVFSILERGVIPGVVPSTCGPRTQFRAFISAPEILVQGQRSARFPSASADSPTSDLKQRRRQLDMQQHNDDERPSRRTKLESKIYNFLTRSRSRSRSKQEATDDLNAKSQKPVRRSSLKKDTTNSPMPGTKPASRIPSRPLSSTTTAANTTITPGTPKPAKRRTPSTLPTQIKPAEQVMGSAPSTSRPTTPKPSAPKKNLQNLWGIPHAIASRRSSRSRSRSRPNSPEPSLDVPPLPTAGFEGDLAPKPRKSTSPHTSRSQPPTTPSKSRTIIPISNSASTGSVANSLKLSKLFLGRTTPSEGIQAPRRPSTSAGITRTPKPAIPTVSGPIRKPTSANRNPKPNAPADSPPPRSSLSSSTSKANGTAALSPPQIVHTPATPIKQPLTNGTDALSLPPSKGKLTPHHVPKFSSMDAGYRYNGGNMSVVDEEGRNSVEVSVTTSFKAKSKEPEPNHLRMGTKTMTTAVRHRKHGSFDFERPGWGASVMQRTNSSGTNGTATSQHSRNGERTPPHERESAFGAGLAGVGTLQRDMSLKRLKDTEEGIKARERAERLHEYIRRDKLPPVPTANGSSSNHSDHLHGSTSTNGTAHTNKSSSLGKATGKRLLAGGRSGAGLPRLIGTQHPLFSFESPVPSPTWSTASNGTAIATEMTTKMDKGSRLKEEVKRRDGEKRPASKGDRPPVPVPIPSAVGRRSGNRGRSLDLGLGLSWAPSTMKEAALLPSTTLFSRSASSSSAGRSASGSTVARSVSSSTNGHESSRTRRVHNPDADGEVERSKMGKEVAELFRNVLDDKGFNSFKTYVRRFDMREIPFDGRNGIVERVEKLLSNARGVTNEDRRIILEKFVQIILQNA